MFSKKLKDWIFIYKLTACLVIFALAVATTVLSVFTGFWYVSNRTKDSLYATVWLQNFDIMASFWSSQTVVIINIWFLWTLIYHKREQENKFTNIYTQTSLTIYITITALIFWSGIIISSFSTSINLGLDWFWNLNPTALVFSFLDHLFAPSLMIIYWLLSFKRLKLKINGKKQFILIIIYPIIYLSYVYMRASFLHYYHVKNFIYPYDILDFNYSIINMPLWINDILVVILIITTVSLTTLFYLLLNKYFYRLAEKKRHELDSWDRLDKVNK